LFWHTVTFEDTTPKTFPLLPDRLVNPFESSGGILPEFQYHFVCEQLSVTRVQGFDEPALELRHADVDPAVDYFDVLIGPMMEYSPVFALVLIGA
jgi:hypothetical protein